jgi:hypothetical protein
MSWLRTKNQKPDYTSLQIQTSTSTLPVPICWGQNKISPNVIWYNNFQTRNGSGGGKGGLFGGNNSGAPTYTADLIMALCEGAIGGVGYIWRDQSTFSLSALGLTLFEGTTPQSDWSYLAGNYAHQTLAYQGTAYVSAASYQLGDAANVGNHNFEILGLGQSSGANGIDCDPAWAIYDFLTNAQYGAGFDASSINATSLFGSGGDASLQTYCKALGIAFSPCLTSQEPASSILSRWLQITNCAAVWSQGELKFLPYGDQLIAAGTVTTSVLTAVPQPSTTSAGGTPPPSIVVCASSVWVADGGVSYTFTGGSLTYAGASAPSTAGTYSISPSGTYLFAAGDEGAAISITYSYAVTTSYVPNLTPAYSLTDSDFQHDKGNDDPIKVSRVDPFSLANIVRLDVLSRSNQYAGTIVEARDQSQIEIYGPRIASTVTAHEICDDINIAQIVAQTILQRHLYVRAHYTFKLGLEYCLLDPMDIVAITDSNLGLLATPVRIISIEEDDRGDLTVEAEELVFGVSTAVVYPNRGVQGYKPNQAYPADAVNPAPLIYEPPPGLTNNVSEIWIGASGGSSGVADPNWGGAYLWISLDNVTYTQFGIIAEPLRQGVLTASLARTDGWDTVDVLSVNLAESAGELTGTSAASAQQGATLSLIDNELISYEMASLTSVYNYNLTGLARGLYGSQPTGHASSAAFYRLDNALLRKTLPSQYIGQTLYFKLQSFNVFGSGLQELSTCTAYSYVPTGQGTIGTVAVALSAGTSVNLGASVSAAQLQNLGNAIGAIASAINLGTARP